MCWKVVRHARYVTFQMAEVAIPRKLFREILRRIERLRLIERVRSQGEPGNFPKDRLKSSIGR